MRYFLLFLLLSVTVSLYNVDPSSACTEVYPEGISGYEYVYTAQAYTNDGTYVDDYSSDYWGSCMSPPVYGVPISENSIQIDREGLDVSSDGITQRDEHSVPYLYSDKCRWEDMLIEVKGGSTRDHVIEKNLSEFLNITITDLSQEEVIQQGYATSLEPIHLLFEDQILNSTTDYLSSTFNPPYVSFSPDCSVINNLFLVFRSNSSLEDTENASFEHFSLIHSYDVYSQHYRLDMVSFENMTPEEIEVVNDHFFSPNFQIWVHNDVFYFGDYNEDGIFFIYSHDEGLNSSMTLMFPDRHYENFVNQIYQKGEMLHFPADSSNLYHLLNLSDFSFTEIVPPHPQTVYLKDYYVTIETTRNTIYDTTERSFPFVLNFPYFMVTMIFILPLVIRRKLSKM